MTRLWAVVLTAALFMVALPLAGESSESFPLADGWRIQSTAKVSDDGGSVSKAGFDAGGWYPTRVPATVLSVLSANGVYPDPYYGINLKSIPGYVDGRWLVMPKDSPFYPPWWYRVEFDLPKDYKGKNLTLHLDGINFKAQVWLNGGMIAGTDKVYGMFRRFEFDVTGKARPGGKNCLAVLVTAPGKIPDRKYLTKQVEATTGWDDHNPQPPDMNLGIWEKVYITASGPVRIKHPYVASDLEVPDLERARLEVSAHLVNLTDREVTGALSGRIEKIRFSQKITLGPGESRVVKFTARDFPALEIDNPRVWWPHPLGPQEMYRLELEFSAGKQVSDDCTVDFGIRKAETYINDEGWRGYRINGKNVLIRGGAWMTSDMMLNLTERRYDALVRYAREANLNMLRSEGFSIRETEEFYGICDHYGVMVTQQIFGRSIPDEDLAIACVEDMMLRIRNHPSLVHFLGHDETFPTETLDRAYRDLIEKYDLRRSYQPHSGAFQVSDRFQTGGTRTGTLELWTHAGPANYYARKIDGAWGFAQSGGIGGIVAPIESVKRMMPEDQLWPPLKTEAWSFHTVIQGGDYYNKLLKNTYQRYGRARDIDDFVMTVSAGNYESARGMYEAYGRNKYSATGITTWKYDAAWPAALTWQYVDWYLLPTAAYYGAKKACEALHIQYSYDDRSVWVINSLYREYKKLKASAEVYDFDLSRKFSRSATVDVGEDGKTMAFTIDRLQGLSRSCFLRLTLDDADGKRKTENFYWLSTRPERPGFNYYGVLPVTPSSRFDHTMLRELKPADLEVECGKGPERPETWVRAKVKNTGDGLAFFVNLAVVKGEGGMEVAPSFWEDNYIALLPGEERDLKAVFYRRDLEGKDPMVRIRGWNAAEQFCRP